MLERSTVPPAAQTGTSMGIVFTTPLVSIMAESGFLGGWPSAFYVFGESDPGDEHGEINLMSTICDRHVVVYLVCVLVFLRLQFAR